MYFYWDDLPGRRLNPDFTDSTRALELKALARAEPQINSRDMVPMAAHYSATGPDSQSTRARKVLAPDRFFLVKPALGTVGKTLQSPGRSDWISRGEEMAERKQGWGREFEDPISLPGGRKLVTLRDAADYITGLPKKESDLPEWQAAIEALMLCSRGGPTMMARIGVMRALNRGQVREFKETGNKHHWGKRRLKRDQ